VKVPVVNGLQSKQNAPASTSDGGDGTMIWLSANLWLGMGAARAAEDFSASTFYFGDMHAHSGVSPDGGSSDLGNCADPAVCGSLAGIFDTAKANGLDFVAFTDHTTSSATDFNDFLVALRAANDPENGFVTIPAAEEFFKISTTELLGHKNGFVFQDDDTLLDTLVLSTFKEPPYVGSCSDVWKQGDKLAAFGPALLFAHHPAVTAPMPTDWSCHDPTYQPVVEVYSEHGNSLAVTNPYDPVNEPIEASTIHAALETYGLQVGFVGGTDNHDSRPGNVCITDTEHATFQYGGSLTMVRLEAGARFDRRAIYDEMVARRTLVTTGPRMPVTVEWTFENGNVAVPGEELRLREGESLELRVAVPTGWADYVLGATAVGYTDLLELTEQGGGVWTRTFGSDEIPAWLYVEVAVDGGLYYATDCADGGTDDDEFVWSSPDWFTVTDDVDLDGVTFTSDCDDDDPTVYPGAVETFYDGFDQDCGLGSDFDADGDGLDALAYGGTDCLDTDDAAYPGAAERWYDGVDQDCSGGSDYDQDADGTDALSYGGTDCQDEDASVFVGAPETWYDGVDQDCGGGSDFDWDGDGTEALAHGGTDCDDEDPLAYAGAAEVWYDGVDQDCAGGSDFDRDGDGDDASLHGGLDCDDLNPAAFGGAAEVWYDGVDEACDGGSDFDQDADGQDALASGGTDCEDTVPSTYLGAAELWYDGVDQDCSGGSDYDQDGDGFDASLYGGTDCADADAATFPGASEVWYDGVDQDCSGGSDYDQDGDGDLSLDHGGTDCADEDADIHPDAPEVWYDGVDQDCLGGSDYDQDVDGYESLAYGGDDCDDLSWGIHPGAFDTWYDGTDANCDGLSDFDQDADGFDDGTVGSGDDCDDLDAGVNPDAAEVWYDGTDQDCSGGSDEDQDGDGIDRSGGDCDDRDAAIGICDTGTTPSEDTGADLGGDDGAVAEVPEPPKPECGCASGAERSGSAGPRAGMILLALALVGRRRR
jgi:hypothetical protein